MDSCDRKFNEIDDLKLQIRSSKQNAQTYLQSNHMTPDQITKQVKRTTQRVKMYRKMKNLQKQKQKLQTERTKNQSPQNQYELTFKVLNNLKKTQKHTHFIERSLDQVLVALDKFDEFV